MDVRCEKCRTEYELDESKLKPGGVTVKCTSCGHMFKVRKRITAIGPAVVGPPTLRNATPEPQSKPTSDLSTDEGRTWLVRLTDGEILTCRELATLQKWIVAGRVNRVCQISRSGKKWKPLGEIGELASFFQIADEAQAAAGKPQTPAKTLMGHPNVVPRVPTGPAGPAAPLPPEKTAPPPIPVQPKVAPPQKVSSPPPQPAAPAKPAAPPLQAANPAPAKPQIVPDARSGGRTTGEWASGGAKMAANIAPSRDSGPSGPVRGHVRPSSQADLEFAGLSARIGDRKGEFENGAFVPTDDDIDDMPPRGAGRLIAIFSILIILGGLAVLYFVVFRDKGEEAATKTVDAGVVVEKTVDAAPPTPADPKDVDEVLAYARKELAADTVAGLELALDRLEKLPADAKTNLPVMAATGQVSTALSQHSLDDAETMERASQKKKAVAKARELAGKAEELGKKVFDADSSNIVANVVLADALRLRGRPEGQVNRYLRKALRIDPANRDALLSRALLFIRSNRERQAKQILTKLVDGDSTDVRAHYRLARILVGEKKYDKAKPSVDAVLAAQPEHAGASALAKILEEELKPEDPVAGDGDTSGDGDSSGDGDGDPTVSVDSYDRLLDRADKAAESGNCSRAIDMYKKALEAKPSGVAALTGLGYCYLDQGRYSTAHTKFRAALGISSRYQDAMWGMAELYKRQNNKTKAIFHYKKFIEAHPGSGRAKTAERLIEQMGGDTGSGSGTGAGTGSGTGAGTGSDTGTGSGTGSTDGTGAGGAGSGTGQKPPDTGGGSGADSPGDEKPDPTPSPTP